MSSSSGAAAALVGYWMGRTVELGYLGVGREVVRLVSCGRFGRALARVISAVQLLHPHRESLAALCRAQGRCRVCAGRPCS
jgi:hypothetical protein